MLGEFYVVLGEHDVDCLLEQGGEVFLAFFGGSVLVEGVVAHQIQAEVFFLDLGALLFAVDLHVGQTGVFLEPGVLEDFAGGEAFGGVDSQKLFY